MTSALRVMRARDRRATPWKDGGGLTREIACSPAGAGLEQFDWRVSIAEIERPGAFSRFPGVDRVIMLLDGPGLTLTVDGTGHALRPLHPFRFDGDAETSCALPGGTTRDLNVMTRRGRCRAEVAIASLTAARRVEACPEAERLIITLEALTVLPLGSPPVELLRLDALFIDASDDGWTLDGHGRLILVDIYDPACSGS